MYYVRRDENNRIRLSHHSNELLWPTNPARQIRLIQIQ